jgi:hypothetical protein
MARSKRLKPWEAVGTQTAVDAHRPSAFVAQHISPLFYRHTDAPTRQAHEPFDTDRDFWRRSTSLPLASVCLRDFQLTNWFPRAPGVYWSRYGCDARRATWSEETTLDPELGRIFNPRSKMALIEDGGIGTIRLCPRRIDNTDCWLATAVTEGQCAGGVPLAIPDFFIRGSLIDWGDTATIYGKVRFLRDANLEDTHVHVHHASPLIIFVDKLEGTPSRHRRSEPLTLTPVALFDLQAADVQFRRRNQNFGYTFVQCPAEHSQSGLHDAAHWMERYAHKHGGQVITNFDELEPTLADAPLSYQRLVAKTYDRVIIERLQLHGKLAVRIDHLVTEYNNFGQVGAMGEGPRSSGNRFVQSASTEPNAPESIKRSGRLPRRRKPISSSEKEMS